MRREQFRGLMLVLWQSFSAFVLWTPGQCYFTYQAFTDYYNAEVDRITLNLVNLQLILDPIIVLLLLSNLRKGVVKKLFCR